MRVVNLMHPDSVTADDLVGLAAAGVVVTPAAEATLKTTQPPTAATKKPPVPDPPSPVAAAAAAPCARCGHDSPDPPNPQPTDADKDALVVALTSTGIFEKTFSLFGGRLFLVMTDLPRVVNDLCYKTAEEELSAWLTENKDVPAPRQIMQAEEASFRIRNLRTAASLKRAVLKAADGTVGFNYARDLAHTPAQLYDRLAATPLSSDLLWGLVTSSYNELGIVLTACKLRATDPNFLPASTPRG